MHCDHWDSHTCRSCSWLDIPLGEQVQQKLDLAKEALNPLPYADSITWLPTATSKETHFRTKAKLVVGGTPRRPTLGILSPQRTGIDLPGCPAQHPAINEVTPALKRIIRALKLQPYDVKQRHGELKYIHINVGANNDLMLRFVLRSREKVTALRTALPEIQKLIPNARVITANIHPRHEATVEGPSEIILTKNTALPLDFGDVTLYLGPQSFSQTNTEVARQLYQQVATWVSQTNPTPTTLWDLYCGVGGFALHTAAAGITHITGIEISKDAIANARSAARQLGLGRERSNFLAADATEWAKAQDLAMHPDALVVNPPRRGIGPDLASWIDSSGIPCVIYSSCNPRTLSSDLQVMSTYQVSHARLFDMFPHTAHAEIAVKLERITQ